MSNYRMRPRFQLHTSLSVEEVLERFEKRLNEPDCPCKGQIRKRHILLRVHDQDRHFWSPFMDLEVNPASSAEGSKANGIVGPSPEVWTGFIAGYSALIFLFFVASILGYAQWSLERQAWGWYALPVIVVLLIACWGLSQLGQKFASTQIELLCKFVYDLVPDAREFEDSTSLCDQA